ncbi:MAG: hypothetical protein JXA67_01865, partial [Micromonosporaceae bacterium]|nr:hypothetical protein [Micromonosporaceae bacterium]
MLRRRVLAIGLASLSAVLTGGCGTGEAAEPGGEKKTFGDETPPSPTFDPAGYSAPKIDIDQLRKLYAYDRKANLDVELTGSQESAGLRIEDLTYTVAKKVTIPLYVVSPYS